MEKRGKLVFKRVTASPPIDSRTGSEYGESSADDYKDEAKRKGKIPSVGRLKDVRVSGMRFEAVESDGSSIKREDVGDGK